MKALLILALTLGLGLSSAQASEAKTIEVGSVLMGTDGQMRVRINGQFLTRQSEKDGIKVLDMDYRQVKLEFEGRELILSPGQTWKHETD